MKWRDLSSSSRRADNIRDICIFTIVIMLHYPSSGHDVHDEGEGVPGRKRRFQVGEK